MGTDWPECIVAEPPGPLLTGIRTDPVLALPRRAEPRDLVAMRDLIKVELAALVMALSVAAPSVAAGQSGRDCRRRPQGLRHRAAAVPPASRPRRYRRPAQPRARARQRHERKPTTPSPCAVTWRPS